MTSHGQEDAEPLKAQKPLEGPQVPPLLLPHYDDAGSSSYQNLGYCLRTNIFLGAPLTWKSLNQESYISPPLPTPPTDPHHWYGHKTDEMVQWMERNFVNHKVNKLLTAMEKRDIPK